MRRFEHHGLIGYRFETLPDGVDAVVSTRHGGVSAAPYDTLNVGFHVGDDPVAVVENRQRLAAAIGAELGAFVVAEQVHEGTVRQVGTAERGRGAAELESAIAATDALISDSPDVVLAVMLADCVPVVAVDPKVPAIGVAHAGWGGTVHHIARNTVTAMADAFGSDPARMVAAIGPSIGPRSYEVGPEVAERARAEYPDTAAVVERDDGALHFDLWGSNLADLTAAGLDPDRIEVAEIDTFRADDVFFSDRRRRPTGRFMTVARLRPRQG
ncbi:MAG: peptidoglycan editing factor PgeF [Solirubrobacterales bacterium]